MPIGTLGRVAPSPLDPSYACLAMYPFEPIRPAWDALWEAVHRSAPWTPATLRWTDDVHATWTDPNCVVGQACGWPVAALAARHRRRRRCLHADRPRCPRASLPQRPRGSRRTLARRTGRRPVPLPSPTVPTACPAGSASWPRSTRSGAGAEWPGEVIWSGAHIESLRHLRDGRADVACIDALEHDAHQAPLPRSRVRAARDRRTVRWCRALLSSSRRRLRARSSTRCATRSRGRCPTRPWLTHAPTLCIDGFVSLDNAEYADHAAPGRPLIHSTGTRQPRSTQ